MGDLDNIMQSIYRDPRTLQEAKATIAQMPQQQQAPQQPAIPADGPSVNNALAAILGPNAGTPAAAPVQQDPGAQQQPQASPVNAMQEVIAAQPKVRHSIIDIIGRLSDGIAKVGGAPAQYQPNLDADTARANAQVDHTQQVTMNGQKITSNGMDNGTQAGKMLQGAASKLQAIVKTNPQADVEKVWGILAQQAGLDPHTAASAIQAIKTDPNALEALASTTDDKEKYSGAVVYATGPDGKLHAFQPGTGSNSGRDVLPTGFTPIDPQKFVDTGGAQVGVGTRSGQVGTTLAKTVDPNKALAAETSRANTADNNTSREHIAADGNATKVQVAGMPARAKPGGEGGDAYTGYRASVQGAKNIHDTLGGLKASPDIDSAVGNVQSRLPTQARANLLAKIAEIKGKVVPQAVSMLKQSGLSRPAQAEVLATANGMVSDLERLDQTPKEYREKIDHAMAFFQNMGRNLNETARRTGVIGGGGKPAAPAKPAAKPAAAGGWSVVKVQ